MANFAFTNGSSAAPAGTATGSSYYNAPLTVGAPTSAMRRGKLYDILVGTNGAPADNFMEFQIARVTTVSTAAATGTLVSTGTNLNLDQADAERTSIVTIQSTAMGTVSAGVPWYIGMNQRASYRWVCAPGSEIVWPATASNGLSLMARSGAYTGTVTGTFMCQEV